MSKFPSLLIDQEPFGIIIIIIILREFGNIGDVFKRYFPRKKVNNVPQKGMLAWTPSTA